MLQFRDKYYIIILILLSTKLFANENLVIDYDFLTGNYVILDSTYSGEYMLMDTINGIELELAKFNLLNGALNGLVVRNIWISPWVYSSVPDTRIVQHYFRGMRHGPNFIFENDNDTLHCVILGEYLFNKRNNSFFYFSKGKLVLSELYLEGKMRCKTFFEESRFIHAKYDFQDNRIESISFSYDGIKFNKVNIEISKSNSIKIIFFLNNEVKSEYIVQAEQFIISWLSDNLNIFVFEVSFIKAFSDFEYLEKIISDIKYRKALK